MLKSSLRRALSCTWYAAAPCGRHAAAKRMLGTGSVLLLVLTQLGAAKGPQSTRVTAGAPAAAQSPAPPPAQGAGASRSDFDPFKDTIQLGTTLQDQLRELEEQRRQAEVEVQRAQGDLSRAQGKKQTVEEQLRETQRGLQSAEQKLVEKRDFLKRCIEILQAARQRETVLNEESAKLREQLEAVMRAQDKERQQFEQIRKDLEAALVAASAERDRLNKEVIPAIKADAERLNREVTGAKAEVDRLNGEATSLKADVARLEKEVERLTRESTALKTEIERLKTEIDRLNKEVDRRDKDVIPPLRAENSKLTLWLWIVAFVAALSWFLFVVRGFMRPVRQGADLRAFQQEWLAWAMRPENEWARAATFADEPPQVRSSAYGEERRLVRQLAIAGKVDAARKLLGTIPEPRRAGPLGRISEWLPGAEHSGWRWAGLAFCWSDLSRGGSLSEAAARCLDCLRQAELWLHDEHDPVVLLMDAEMSLSMGKNDRAIESARTAGQRASGPKGTESDLQEAAVVLLEAGLARLGHSFSGTLLGDRSAGSLCFDSKDSLSTSSLVGDRLYAELLGFATWAGQQLFRGGPGPVAGGAFASQSGLAAMNSINEAASRRARFHSAQGQLFFMGKAFAQVAESWQNATGENAASAAPMGISTAPVGNPSDSAMTLEASRARARIRACYIRALIEQRNLNDAARLLLRYRKGVGLFDPSMADQGAGSSSQGALERAVLEAGRSYGGLDRALLDEIDGGGSKPGSLSLLEIEAEYRQQSDRRKAAADLFRWLDQNGCRQKPPHDAAALAERVLGDDQRLGYATGDAALSEETRRELRELAERVGPIIQTPPSAGCELVAQARFTPGKNREQTAKVELRLTGERGIQATDKVRVQLFHEKPGQARQPVSSVGLLGGTVDAQGMPRTFQREFGVELVAADAVPQGWKPIPGWFALKGAVEFDSIAEPGPGRYELEVRVLRAGGASPSPIHVDLPSPPELAGHRSPTIEEIQRRAFDMQQLCAACLAFANKRPGGATSISELARRVAEAVADEMGAASEFGLSSDFGQPTRPQVPAPLARNALTSAAEQISALDTAGLRVYATAAYGRLRSAVSGVAGSPEALLWALGEILCRFDEVRRACDDGSMASELGVTFPSRSAAAAAVKPAAVLPGSSTAVAGAVGVNRPAGWQAPRTLRDRVAEFNRLYVGQFDAHCEAGALLNAIDEQVVEPTARAASDLLYALDKRLVASGMGPVAKNVQKAYWMACEIWELARRW